MSVRSTEPDALHPPAAVHIVEIAHETEAMLYVTLLAGTANETTVHVAPFQRALYGTSLLPAVVYWPVARQNAVGVQDTLRRRASVAEPGVGATTIDQLVPFQRSMTGTRLGLSPV